MLRSSLRQARLRELQHAAGPCIAPRAEVHGLRSRSSAGSFSWAFSLRKACPRTCSLSAAALVCTHKEEDYELPVMGTNLSLGV